MEKEILKEDKVIKCMKKICDYYNKNYKEIKRFLDNNKRVK